MGQYYKPIILKDNKSKKTIDKWVYSWDYGNGLKLMEHSYVGNNFVNVVENELKENPQRLVWAGDYADHCKGRESNLYDRTHRYEDNKIVNGNEDFNHEVYRYIVNHSKKQFVDKTKLQDIEGWEGTQINPLPILTSEGNGSGGGDFRGENKYIGTWARDVISIEMKQPKGFKEITPDFVE